MARRNANGEGSIYRRKDGRWEGTIYVATTSGKRKRLSVYGATRQVAHEKLLSLQLDDLTGKLAPDKAWRLGDYLEHWLEEFVRKNRRPATYLQCETVARLHLKPDIGNKHLKSLTVPFVQFYLNELRTNGTSFPKLQVIRKVLSAALTHAVRLGLIEHNVARAVALEDSYRPREVQPWSATEAIAFLRAAANHTWYPLFLLLLLYGLRRGEVLGLRKMDIDFASSELRIRQQLQRVGRQLLIGPVKTKAGERNLPLVPLAADVLRTHLAKTNSQRSELAFTTSADTPIEPRNFARTFQRLCKRHNLRLIRVHDVRHTTATLLKNLGVPARDAQLILGHARVTTTQELYQHGDMATSRRALSGIEQLLGGGAQTKDAPAEELGHLMDVGDGYGSRQFSRQTAKLVASVTSIISGAGTGTLTRDLILGKAAQSTVQERTTDIDNVMGRACRTWKLGSVAVNLAVNLC